MIANLQPFYELTNFKAKYKYLGKGKRNKIRTFTFMDTLISIKIINFAKLWHVSM